jgi:hypothetical protein
MTVHRHLNYHLDDHALAGDGEGEHITAAAAHEGVHKAREDALGLLQSNLSFRTGIAHAIRQLPTTCVSIDSSQPRQSEESRPWRDGTKAGRTCWGPAVCPSPTQESTRSQFGTPVDFGTNQRTNQLQNILDVS